ncbi:MAG: hypothetical protein HC836_12355 [Richelia sp. RM2_1_2]|nr:hypothetical protein [Richelia sp. SM2_1_7]NJM19026.1 hypothetical protein [Richelia sp. SM1_7_0]NJN08832.1 hypothetical protein [Richelia sp. RM1_1_1]NJO29723.1 hypothetical protein [Richelia sp. SL_2_1]NJO59086.1 hypothetical protein [Richelia sp. RM2_1_2]
MKRIIRLNAVEILCQSGIIVGMNQHSLHKSEHLVPQKLIVSGMNFASQTEAFVNTANTKCNILLAFKAAMANTRFFRGFSSYLVQVQIKLALLRNDGGNFMYGKVISSYEDAENQRKISERLIKLNGDGGTKTD